MPKSRKKKAPKRTLALPDLEHAKSAVLNSLSFHGRAHHPFDSLDLARRQTSGVSIVR